MNDDTEMLIVCNPVDAEYILSHCGIDDLIDIQISLVITNAVPVGEMTAVPKDEFLDYLNNGDYKMRGNDDWFFRNIKR